ncbi:uncharacterized protein PHALS_03516 [Plasmopara halstedii]|uniref:Uncharacterized protein n=1 Tax=Plasmopara halstedii TaxID=4781 RepID=A0A0P1AYT6_PLAHL|nr:uncharacterized protein PHALS_03516 [Plasmopara halstedii]CEG46839.1 hypothetical protein PHALS_03516 [Plasmopara halstedii]|eukprot:XP_024583208.1 hypothetical protein PHALS_03516 [Plasmopara halstedii]
MGIEWTIWMDIRRFMFHQVRDCVEDGTHFEVSKCWFELRAVFVRNGNFVGLKDFSNWTQLNCIHLFLPETKFCINLSILHWQAVVIRSHKGLSNQQCEFGYINSDIAQR